VSFNGGHSWTQVVIPKVSACSGSPTWIRASDPWLSFAPNGVLYHISLSTTGGITNRFPDSAILVSRSTDGGKTWSDPTTLKQDAGPNILNDKESITADPNSSSFVYGVWDRLLNAGGSPSTESFENAIGFRGPAWFSRTTNGGTSWEPARIIFDPGQENQTIGNQIVVSPDGTLFDFFDLIQNFGNPSGRTFNVAFIKSTDHGATWSGAVRVDKINRVQVRDPDTGQRVRTEDFAPEVAVDPSNGNLYAVWQDSRFSGGTRADAAFSMSTNGGASWSPTIKVNANSAGTAAFNPSVHVLADGTVGVGFYDFRNNTSASGVPTDYWLVHCHSATEDCSNASSWDEETHVAGPFDIEKAPTPGSPGQFFLGDYMGLDNAGTDFANLFIQAGSSTNSSDAWYSSVG